MEWKPRSGAQVESLKIYGLPHPKRCSYYPSMRRIALSLVMILPVWACDSSSSDDNTSAGETGSNDTATDDSGSEAGETSASSGDDSSDGMDDSGDSSDADGGDDSGNTTGGVPQPACEKNPEGISVTVDLKDTTGADIEGAGQLCGPVMENGIPENCFPTCEMEDGTILGRGLNPGLYNLKFVLPDTDTTAYSSHAMAIDLEAMADVAVTYHLPIVGEFTDLEEAPETEVTIDEQLKVTIDPSEEKTDFGLGVFEKKLAGARIDAAYWPFTTVGDNNDEVVAIWAFAPYGAKSVKDKESGEYASDFAFSISDSLGLEDGATVNFYTIDKDSAWTMSAGSSTVSEGAIASGEEGLHQLSWLIVAKPAG